MKKLVHFLLTLGVLLGLGWTLWIGMRRQHERAEAEIAEVSTAEPTDGPKPGSPEAFVVTLDKEASEALDVQSAVPEPAEMKPQRRGFGRVIDPTPLVALDGELSSAEAALAATRAEHERTQMLLAAGENTSHKAAEAAEAQFRVDDIKVDSLRRSALMAWGAAVGSLDPEARHQLVGRLMSGATALVRVDLLAGEALDGPPLTARAVVLGHESQPVATTFITPAVDANAKTQGQGFILRVEDAPFPLRPGMALTAWLEMADAVRAGFAIPRSAILRHDGRSWVYVQVDDTYVRTAVTLGSPLEGERGWFVAAEDGGIKAGQRVVVTGAASLLSEELKAQGGASD